MKDVTVHAGLLLTFALALPSGGEAQSRRVLEPTEHCRDHSPSAIVTFADPDLEEVVRGALSVGAQADLTCGLVSGLTRLTAPAEFNPRTNRVIYGGHFRESPVKRFESLEGIQNLTGLTSLSMGDRLITDIGPLSELTNLTSLSLHTNWISDVSPLSGLTNLTQLTLSENQIGDIGPLRGLTNLTLLRLHSYYPVQTAFLVARDPALGPGVLENEITDISAVSGMTNLRELRLHLHEIKDISALRGLTNLQNLRLYGNGITDISALSGMTNLNLLWLHDNSITDVGPLRGLTRLVQLGLANNSISDISALSELRSLEALFLSGNSITDTSPLSRLQNLEILRLANNSITDLSPLRRLTNLRELALDNNEALYDVQPLLANEGLGAGDELDLRFTWVTCSDAAALERKGVTLLSATVLNGSGCPGRLLTDPPPIR